MADPAAHQQRKGAGSGVFGAAATAARVLGLDREQTTNALAIALAVADRVTPRAGDEPKLGATVEVTLRDGAQRPIVSSPEEQPLSGRPSWYGQITEESVERMRQRIGVRKPGPGPWIREAQTEPMRIFAWGFGDDNPLFTEPDYGEKTRWQAVIGTPFFATALHKPIAPEIPAEERERTRGALAGLHEYHVYSEFHFYRPVYPGDRAYSCKWVESVEEKESRFGGGHSILRTDREYIEAEDGAPILDQQLAFVHAERDSAAKAGSEKKEKAAPPAYSAEDIEAIEADILAEEIRGAQPRYWEDVAVGDTLGPLTKGPMTVTDIIGSHIGRGPGHYFWGPFRLNVRRRQEHPGFYTRNEFGAWDVVQRVHWDHDFAQSVGAARAYDYGSQRLNWHGQLLTDWMGDDAWIVRLKCRYRRFNYVGDVSRVTGTVTAKNDDGTVEIELACTNQRGENTSPGDATLALPTRANPAPALPAPPADWPGVR